MTTDKVTLSNLSNAEYHANPYVSKSHLDLIDKSPFHYWDRYINPDRIIPEPTKAMLLGSAFHAIVLEPEVFERDYIVEPEDAPKRPTTVQRNAKKPSSQTQEAIAFWDEFDTKAADKTLVPIEDFNRLTIMKQRVFEHPAASTILKMKGLCEQSYKWTDEHTGEVCKSRPDFHTEDGTLIVDLKTTGDASELGFQKSVHNFRYHVQAGWYLRSLEQAEQFVFIAVESKPPHLVAVYNASEAMIAAGNRVADKNLALLAECRKSDKWIGYSEEITNLDLPRYNND
tara:strand:+ start:847 stop:1701 length:855 start_codon:yes stop_codon:yes gene_type:complete